MLEPAPFDVDVEADQSGWRYRLVRDGHEIVLQAFEDGQWNDNYSFIPTPAAFADVEASNRFTSTDPASPFVSGLFAGARYGDRELTLFTHERPTMHERIVGQPSIPTFVELSEVPRLLAQRFKIPGARVDEDGRVTL